MRKRSLLKYSFIAVVVMLAIVVSTGTGSAQTTSFTYQGRLRDGGTAANGNDDLQFALWDSLTNGSQIGRVLPMRGSKIFPHLSRNAATFANGQEEFVA